MPTVLPVPVAPPVVAPEPLAVVADDAESSSPADWLVQAPSTTHAAAAIAQQRRMLIIVIPPDPTSSELSSVAPKPTRPPRSATTAGR